MIEVRKLADSISPQGKRITSLEVEFPRIILAEVNTHGMISKNYSSTRAVPIKIQQELIDSDPVLPVFYGKNQSGMVAEEELSESEQWTSKQVILDMLGFVQKGVITLGDLGLHKQSSGRYLEPWMKVKGVLTSTEWSNFLWLRDHPDAQPEFQILSSKIKEVLDTSEPVELGHGDWHLPYYKEGYWINNGKSSETLEEARMISASCCAQVSYRKTDDSLEKAKRVFDLLNIGKKDVPQHVSPTEHQATPMEDKMALQSVEGWHEGVTSYHKELGFMSGNLSGWIQYRHLIEGNTVW